MRKKCMIGIFGIALFLSGCGTYSANYADNDEQVDLYLSTLDDKHFVWCKLDLEQCRTDFDNWKITPRGRVITKEYEKEKTGQMYNTHHVTNAFRTHFVDESQFVEQDENIHSEGITESPGILGPEVPSNY